MTEIASRTSGHRRDVAFHAIIATPIPEDLRTLELERGNWGRRGR
jgi:hypothetical protein